MRYSLLNYLRCQACHASLSPLVESEADSPMPHVIMAPFDRVPPAGAVVGPVPVFRIGTPIAESLVAHAAKPASPERNYDVEMTSGLLVCGECGHWYPVVNSVPELLPDHLRDWRRDRAIAEGMTRIPRDLRHAVLAFDGDGTAEDGGARYKQAEINIANKIDDPAFFGPGYSSPFNLWNSAFTLYLIKLFGNVVPLLEARPNSVILDSGCGYGWTTEWLFKSGFEAIGVDICRTYVDVGLARMGSFRPHLVVADVENLPIGDACVDGVLAYESFHHVPDRARAMAGFSRILKDGGRVVLAEPGGEHDTAPVSLDAMSKYGILEKGMELEDVRRYVEGTELGAPEQVHLVKIGAADLPRIAFMLSPGWREVVEGNVFTLCKAASGHGRPEPPPIVREGAALAVASASAAVRSRRAPSATAVVETFDEHYFAKCCGRPYGRDAEWLTFFGGIADRIVTDIAPSRVLDAGCAMGLLVEALRDRGVDAYGVDISSYAIDHVAESVKPFCRQGSIADPLPFADRFDLIVSIEVLEHMPAADAERALDNLCRYTDDVLFSSTPTDFGEPTHVNVRPPEYWGEQFARRGLVRDVDFDATFITPWGVRFRRTREPLHRVIAGYERRLARLEAERHDVRARATASERELASALHAVDELRALNARLTAEWATQAENMLSKVRQAEIDLAIERNTVVNMKRSAFWRARSVWVWIARLFGRET